MITQIRPNSGALVYDGLVSSPEYRATKVFQDYLAAVDRLLPSLLAYVVSDNGAAGDGIRNDTLALQSTIDKVIAAGGGTVILPPGDYSIDTVTIPAGSVPVTLLGYGPATILHRRSVLATGKGMLDIFGSNVTIENLAIDGGVTVPVGLFYNQDFIGIGNNDPMADSLTRNSSIWLHPGADNFTARDIKIQHTAGYAILLDANGDGGIGNIRILDCEFSNNRPNLFGIPGGDAIYGSWTGGIYVNGDGRAANPTRVLRGLLVERCRFLRNTGNCLWSHLYGLDELHSDFRFSSNYFLDCGLDGILVGGVAGGSVNNNVFHRIGYVCLTDTDRSTPRWLPNLNATALDSSGLVKGVPYTGNSFLSINGGCMDLDSHGDSVISGNVCRVPYPDESEYDEDQIAISGPLNNGSASNGVNLGNSQNTPYGAAFVSIVGNTFINLPTGAVRLFSARNCLVESNNIIVPDVPLYPPIGYGPTGTGPNQRATGNVIKHNRFQYSPSMAAPFVFEDPTITPFQATDINYVFGNCPIIGASGLATEFQKDPNSGSPVYLETVWFT